MFQFYLSSIKSLKVCNKGKTEFSFNSTLVQLKAIYHIKMDATYMSFNSTLVQLKV